MSPEQTRQKAAEIVQDVLDALNEHIRRQPYYRPPDAVDSVARAVSLGIRDRCTGKVELDILCDIRRWSQQRLSASGEVTIAPSEGEEHGA